MTNRVYKAEEINKLIDLAKSGDIEALEEILRRIQKKVYIMFSYLTDQKQDLSDLTQEALLKTAKGISSLKDSKMFKSWINHIVTNTFYDYIRKHSTDNKLDFDNNKLLEIKDKIGCEPGEKCFFSEIDKLIKAALLSLPKNMRIAIVLREYEGLSYEDISQITNASLGTVKSRIARARIRLQKELKEFI